MSKSVYSIVLSDEVVAAVDRVAYENGLSRSAMIDRLLAQAVSCVTPEMRMQEIFSQVEQLLTVSGVFQPMLQPSKSMMSLRSALRYKYNPTVRYSVELDAGKPGEGTLRVSLRSQSSTLILYFGRFFRLWVSMERQLAEMPDCRMEEGGFSRCFSLPRNLSEQQQGELLAAYIQAMQTGMKGFFTDVEADPNAAVAAVAKACEDYYRQYSAI